MGAGIEPHAITLILFTFNHYTTRTAWFDIYVYNERKDSYRGTEGKENNKK